MTNITKEGEELNNNSKVTNLKDILIELEKKYKNDSELGSEIRILVKQIKKY